MNRKPSFISLFSGAGLFDQGFVSAGFRPLISIDSCPDACKSIKLNSNHIVLNDRIENIKITDFFTPSEAQKLELDLLVGGPPCQPYSKSKYGVLGNTSGKSDERYTTLKTYMSYVKYFQPKCFIIENVPQMLSGKNSDIKTYINNATKYINKKTKSNYVLTHHKVNCANYGVPQMRERVFIVGCKDGISFKMPEITHYENGDEDLDLLPYVTSSDAIGDLNRKFSRKSSLKPTGQWSDLLKSIPPGENYLWHTDRKGGKNIFKWRSRYWNFLLKLSPTKPSWTITANPGHMTGPFHWSGRRLAIDELKRLQTLPISYKLYGSTRSKQKQIGNGVPSLIGEILGKQVRKQVFNHRVSTKNYKNSIQSELDRRPVA